MYYIQQSCNKSYFHDGYNVQFLFKLFYRGVDSKVSLMGEDYDAVELCCVLLYLSYAHKWNQENTRRLEFIYIANLWLT